MFNLDIHPMQTKRIYQLFSSLIMSILMGQVGLLGSDSPGKYINNGTESFSINFDLVNGLILLEASVDHIRGKYILDTGCSFIAIDGVEGKGDIELSSTEFSATASETNLAKFELGGIKLENIEALEFDMKKIEAIVGTDIDGLIGTQAMMNYNILIDYTEMKVSFLGDQSPQLNINSLSHTIIKSAMTTHDNQSSIDVQIQDQSYTLLLDSGANISVFDYSYKKSLKHLHQKNKSSIVADDYIIEELSLNRVTIKDMAVLYRDLSLLQDNRSGQKIDGILSLTSLDADKVLFDYTNSQVIFFWAHEDIAAVE